MSNDKPTPRTDIVPRHHDGFGLNDRIAITADERDAKGGGSSNFYRVTIDGEVCAEVQFQHGPRAEPDSTPGLTDAVLLAIVLDRYEGFQAGPFRCRENALVATKLEEAMHWMQHRARERAQRGVLGKNQK